MSAASRIVSVALPLPIRKSFSYRVPEDLPLPAAGARVRVPFSERVLTGVVTGEASAEGRRLREVVEVLDREPVCPPDLLAAVERVAHRFFASTGEVVKSALPARLPRAGAARYQRTEQGSLAKAATGAERDVLDRLAGGKTVGAGELSAGRQDVLRSLEEKGWIRVAIPAEKRRRPRDRVYAAAPLETAERERRLSRSPRGRQVLDYLHHLGRGATASEVRDATSAGPGVLKSLLSRGLVIASARPDAPEGNRAAQAPSRVRVLTPEQQIAWDVLRDAVARRRYFPALLHGVTGSGKTELYLRAIAATLEAGRGAIWLVPEIALTPIFARELTRQFGDRAAVLHSALSEKERGRAWDRTRSGRVKVVIGPRSAAFAPVADPGLFLVDEEHDSSYKQRESPRYDAREVVAIRARAAKAVLLFGTATPSMEAYRAAQRGRVASLRLTERVDGRPLPAVQIVDLKHEPARPEEKGVALFSRALIERLREVFARREQAILLQPRRGFAPILLCRECGYDFRCESCSVSRTVHARGSTLVCHYCGHRRPAPPRCPECGGGLLEAVGAGTERVADRFAETFPGVPFGVLDRDSARRRGIGPVLDDMQSGAIACLIGTQMVAKGHDFENVTAVGVLSADTILNFPDFRAGEKTFQLVAQVAGRAGRGDKPGTVHVQTFHPKHPAITRAAAHDVDGFARDELEFRRVFFYPPYSELAQVMTSSADRERAEREARQITDRLRQTASSVRISGPAPAPLERLLGLWRYQILLRASNRSQILSALEAAVPERSPAGVQLAIDVDPQDLM
jgi:primosomal protein N' (replication factor Y) (superfamily II helicase)